MCQKGWDNFYFEKVLLNEELRNNARAVFNEQTEEEFHNALYDNDDDYARLANHVLDCLVNQGLLTEEKHEGLDSTYWKTAKLHALCPEIVRYHLPGIQDMVEQYDRQHQQ
jgi:hypothetical protein